MKDVQLQVDELVCAVREIRTAEDVGDVHLLAWMVVNVEVVPLKTHQHTL